jgi:Tol biopolymer transport system component
MFCPICRLPIARRLRALLSRLFALAVLVALGACDGADSPVAPTGADEALPPSAEPPPGEAVAGGDMALLTTSQRIVFTSARKGGRDIFTMDPQGYNIVRRTATVVEESNPAWSYDNKCIAMVRFRGDTSKPQLQDIYLMNADGTNKRWARSSPSSFSITEPSWSPDGSTLVVTVLFQYTPYLATMKVSTGEMAFVTLGGKIVQGRRPSYDPTGKEILYIGPGGRTIDGVRPEENIGYRYVSSDTEVDRPTYSPDGSKIAYSKWIAGTSNRDIFVYTSRPCCTTKRLTTHAAIDWQPTWSPDGTKIAFSSTRSGQYQTWTMNAATGGNLTRITHTSTIEKDPAWSH